MRLDQALKKVGATVAKNEKRPDGGLVIFLRVDPKMSGEWNDCLTEFLLASARENTWRVDVSKYFFADPQAATVKYLWRVILMGDINQASGALARAAIRSIQQQVEVMSQPLVGRKNYVHDPANGKTAGVYPVGSGEQVLVSALNGRGGQ